MPASLAYAMFKSKSEYPLHTAVRTKREDVLFLYLVENDSKVRWEGMGHVGLARYELALLPPCLTIRVFSYSNCQGHRDFFEVLFFILLSSCGPSCG